MPDETRYVAAIGALYNVPLVVVGVAFTAVAWFNGLELLLTVFATFKRRSTYSYSLVVATLGVLCFQSAVFCMIFAPRANGYGIIAFVDIGWTCMVTGQSMVLWSRLHLVCHCRWKLRAALTMIITDAILCHGTQTVCSLLAVRNNTINPEYPPFIYTEKVSLCIFTTQEVVLSGLYIRETVQVLRLASAVKEGSRYLRMRNLLLANVAILALDVCLLSLEFAALWGVWCTFKGFAYSIKLKIEFAILNQLRDTITNPTALSSAGTGTVHRTSTAVQQRQSQRLSAGVEGRGEASLTSLGNQAQCFPTGLGEGGANHSGCYDQIRKTTEYTISHLDGGEEVEKAGTTSRPQSTSPASSEVECATTDA